MNTVHNLIPSDWNSFIQSYENRLDPFWVNFWMWCQVQVQFHSFSCNCLLDTELFVSKIVIPCGQSFLTCEKLVCHIYMPVFLDYHLDPIDVYICPYGSTIISIFSFFCSKLWNQKILATQFWYSFKIILIIPCQLTFHINFWNNLSVSWGKYPYLRF